jgi:nucleotide-binding universal stress UspA family protein
VTKTPIRVLVLSDGDTVAATVEAALRDRPDVHVLPGRPRALRQLIDERDPTVVVLASTAARAAAALGGIA